MFFMKVKKQFFMFSCLSNRLVLQAGSLTDACLLKTSCSRACWWGKRHLQKNVSSTLALLQLLDSEEHMRLFFPITNFSSLTRNISSIPFQLAFLQWQSINYILILFLRKNSVVLKEASCWNKKYFKLFYDLRWNSTYSISLAQKDHSGATYKWKLHNYIWISIKGIK